MMQITHQGGVASSWSFWPADKPRESKRRADDVRTIECASCGHFSPEASFKASGTTELLADCVSCRFDPEKAALRTPIPTPPGVTPMVPTPRQDAAVTSADPEGYDVPLDVYAPIQPTTFDLPDAQVAVLSALREQQKGEEEARAYLKSLYNFDPVPQGIALAPVEQRRTTSPYPKPLKTDLARDGRRAEITLAEKRCTRCSKIASLAAGRPIEMIYPIDWFSYKKEAATKTQAWCRDCVSATGNWRRSPTGSAEREKVTADSAPSLDATATNASVETSVAPPLDALSIYEEESVTISRPTLDTLLRQVADAQRTADAASQTATKALDVAQEALGRLAIHHEAHTTDAHEDGDAGVALEPNPLDGLLDLFMDIKARLTALEKAAASITPTPLSSAPTPSSALLDESFGKMHRMLTIVQQLQHIVAIEPNSLDAMLNIGSDKVTP